MLMNEPFPIENCSERLKSALMGQFARRCPSVREVVNVPASHWAVIPGLGPATLRELRHLIRSMPDDVRMCSLTGLTEAELLNQYARLNIEIVRLQHEFRNLQSELKAISAELRTRGVLREVNRIKHVQNKSKPMIYRYKGQV